MHINYVLSDFIISIICDAGTLALDFSSKEAFSVSLSRLFQNAKQHFSHFMLVSLRWYFSFYNHFELVSIIRF